MQRNQVANNTDPAVVLPTFLGISNKVQIRGCALDIVGLTKIAAVDRLPQRFDQWSFVFVLPVTKSATSIGRIEICEANKSDVLGWLDWNYSSLPMEQSISLAEAFGTTYRSGEGVPKVLEMGIHSSGGLSCAAIPIPGPPVAITVPGDFDVFFISTSGRVKLGSFMILWIEPSPISQAEALALQADGKHPQFIALALSCNVCGDECTALVPRTGSADFSKCTKPNPVLLSQMEDFWKCGCGKSIVPLEYAKRSIPSYLRLPISNDGNLSFARAYEEHAISGLILEFQKLLAKSSAEEEVQVFLERHPIFWGFLSPSRILFKPPILTKHRADFGVLSRNKVLHLVEIEKPQTKLAKKGGGLSSELQAGLDQVREWRVVVQDHRDALLSELGFSKEEVDDIKFIVVAGLAASTSPSGLTILRRDHSHDVQLICFDELVAFLANLASELRLL